MGPKDNPRRPCAEATVARRIQSEVMNQFEASSLFVSHYSLTVALKSAMEPDAQKVLSIEIPESC